MVEILNLYKSYGRFCAVNNLSLSIPKGAIYGLVGPNGAGKTTTMKIMSGLLTATSGQVIIDGVDVIKSPRALTDKIGFMPDFFGVYDNLKVDEYMDFYEGAYYIPYDQRRALTDNLLELVDLSDKKDAYVDLLSRGMKQRLCVARCLIHDPEVVILDEPASGLDPRARIELKEILKQLKLLGKTIIISSHILSELAELCTDVGIIDRGQVMLSGPIADVMRGMSINRVFVIKSLSGLDALVKILEQTPSASDIAENADSAEFAFSGTDIELSRLIKEIVETDIPIVGIREKEGNLEQVFMEVTGMNAAHNSSGNSSNGIGGSPNA